MRPVFLTLCRLCIAACQAKRNAGFPSTDTILQRPRKICDLQFHHPATMPQWLFPGAQLTDSEAPKLAPFFRIIHWLFLKPAA
jgi:hypothetical protein